MGQEEEEAEDHEPVPLSWGAFLAQQAPKQRKPSWVLHGAWPEDINADG